MRDVCAGRWRTALLFSGAMMLTSGLPVAFAQLQTLDRGQLLDGLIQEQMPDLVDHLLATERVEDPVERRQWEIARYRLEYNDPARPREQRLAIFQAMREAAEALFEEAPDHPRRPIWQTDLAERLLTDWLQGLHLQALSFYEFGLPTREQQAVVEAALPEALGLLRQAEAGLNDLARRAANDETLRRELEASGLWQRLFEEYREHRTRFFLAQTAYLTTRLPGAEADAHKPLLKQAAAVLEPLIEDPSDLAGIRPMARRLLGQIQAAEGRGGEAIRAQLTPALRAEGAGTFRRVQAALALAQVQAREQQFVAAIDTLTEAAADPLVLRTPLLMLLITDARHQALLAEAEASGPQRAARRQVAYQLYEELFDQPALGAAAESLRAFVFDRWADQVPAGAETELPAPVRSAVAEVLVTRGQQQMLAAEASGETATIAAARAALVRAEALCRTLRAEDVPAEARARGLYNLGRAIYWQDRSRTDRLLQAATIWTEVGRDHAQQPVAEAAMGLAMSVLLAEHQRQPDAPPVAAAFARAGEVLFERFPTSATADDLRVYYAFHVLQQTGLYARALAVYGPVPFDHAGYFDARAQMLFCLEALLDDAPEAQRPAYLAELAQLGEAVRLAAESQAAPAARQALGAARLALARVAGEEQRPEAVLTWLSGIEAIFEHSPGTALMPRVFERRIEALITLDRLAEAEAPIRALIAIDAAAVAPVVDRLLGWLEGRLTAVEAQWDATADAQLQADLARMIHRQARLALPMAHHMADWAGRQTLTEAQRLPFELALVRLARLAGDQALAQARVAPLLRQFSTEGQVILEAAETGFASGDRQQLAEAARLFDRLIAASGQGDPLPPVFWQAWLRRLEISEQLQQNTADIARRVRLLERRDPQLGSPRIQAALSALRDRHS